MLFLAACRCFLSAIETSPSTEKRNLEKSCSDIHLKPEAWTGPSFGCIMVLLTGIYFLPLGHVNLVGEILLFTMAIPLQGCTEHSEKYVDNDLVVTDVPFYSLAGQSGTSFARRDF